MTQTVTRVEQLDPRALMVDVNVRSDIQLDKQFVATIRDHGVLVPIVGIDTADGVRSGSATGAPSRPSRPDSTLSRY